MVVETTVLYIVLACAAARRECGTLEVQFSSADRKRTLVHEERAAPKLSVGYGDATSQMLAKDFGVIPQVKYVLTEDVSDTFLVWVVVDDPSPDVRRRVYEKELDLMSEFENIPFDFNLLPAMGRLPKDIVTGAKVAYLRPE